MKRHVLEFERPIHDLELKLADIKRLAPADLRGIAEDVRLLELEIEKLRDQIFKNLGPWEKVQIARHPDRPRSSDHIDRIFSDFQTLRGDRSFHDDRSIIGGTARLNGVRVIIVAQQKGKNLKDNIVRNFGMNHPEGFRKAKRLFKLAERMGLPVVTFIDTPGAYPGVDSEERGIAFAIAENLMAMSLLKVPIVAVNIGEGGSGGALGVGVADKVLMLENAYYSVASPEGCASILWRDEKMAKEATIQLKITAEDLLEFGIIDEIVPEPLGGAHRDPRIVSDSIKNALIHSIQELSALTTEQLVESRYQKYRNIGRFSQN